MLILGGFWGVIFSGGFFAVREDDGSLLWLT
jgi:hypothetical protein